MSDFFALRDHHYEDLSEIYGGGDHVMDMAEDLARVDHQRMFALEERWHDTPLTYEEQEALSIKTVEARLPRKQTTTPFIPIGLSLLELGLFTGAMCLSVWLTEKLLQTQEQQVQSASHSHELNERIQLLEEIQLLEKKIQLLKEIQDKLQSKKQHKQTENPPPVTHTARNRLLTTEEQKMLSLTPEEVHRRTY